MHEHLRNQATLKLTDGDRGRCTGRIIGWNNKVWPKYFRYVDARLRPVLETEVEFCSTLVACMPGKAEEVEARQTARSRVHKVICGGTNIQFFEGCYALVLLRYLLPLLFKLRKKDRRVCVQRCQLSTSRFWIFTCIGSGDANIQGGW